MSFRQDTEVIQDFAQSCSDDMTVIFVISSVQKQLNHRTKQLQKRLNYKSRMSVFLSNFLLSPIFIVCEKRTQKIVKSGHNFHSTYFHRPTPLPTLCGIQDQARFRQIRLENILLKKKKKNILYMKGKVSTVRKGKLIPQYKFHMLLSRVN